MSCPACFQGEVHHHSEPKGKIEALYGMSCYITSPPSTSSSNSKILFITDALGLNLVNNKLLADRYAAETGCTVLVPDAIPGGGAPVTGLYYMDKVMAPVAWTDITGQILRIWAGINFMIKMLPFILRANTAKAYPGILEFARAMKKDIPADGRLGVASFCWGAYASTRLCTDTADEGGSTPLIDAHFTAHPSRVKPSPGLFVDAVSKKVPYSLAIGDKDVVMGLDEVHQVEAALREKVGEPDANDYEVRIFPGGVGHGFAVRPSLSNKVEMEASEAAAQQAISWFNKYLNRFGRRGSGEIGG